RMACHVAQSPDPLAVRFRAAGAGIACFAPAAPLLFASALFAEVDFFAAGFFAAGFFAADFFAAGLPVADLLAAAPLVFAAPLPFPLLARSARAASRPTASSMVSSSGPRSRGSEAMILPCFT